MEVNTNNNKIEWSQTTTKKGSMLSKIMPPLALITTTAMVLTAELYYNLVKNPGNEWVTGSPVHHNETAAFSAVVATATSVAVYKVFNWFNNYPDTISNFVQAIKPIDIDQ